MKKLNQTRLKDPFGNLTDWGSVLSLIEALDEKGELAECQPGLIRILKYKANWRLREAVLKRIGQIENPCEDLFHQVLAILNDDNIYFDARILASSALVHLLHNTHNGCHSRVTRATQKVIGRLLATPQPPCLEDALKNLGSEIGFPAVWPDLKPDQI